MHGSPSAATFADMAHVLDESHGTADGRGFLRRPDGDVPLLVRPGDCGSRSPTRRARCRHRTSDSDVDRPTIARSVPWDEVPRYLLRDRDHAFDELGATAHAMGIHEVLTAPRSPWQNAYVERFIGSARRECLDHVIVFNETGLQRLMKAYCTYYDGSRTHLSLAKDARRFLVRSARRPMAESLRPHRLAASITSTNGTRPDRNSLSLTRSRLPMSM
jgi:hypothetical protein